MLNIISSFCKDHKVRKIVGWISAEDVYYEYGQREIENFFIKNGFSIISDKTRFRGSVLKVEKEIK